MLNINTYNPTARDDYSSTQRKYRVKVQRAGFEPANPYGKGFLIEAHFRPNAILSPWWNAL